MELKGGYKIAADRQAVWQAINDPDMLKACIPGCEELEKTSETSFAATVKAKVGPVSARFKGEVSLEDINAPESYRIVGEGKGGVAGFAKGGAVVKLTEEGALTALVYDADAQIGGKLAQIGSRLVRGTAKKLADQFFKNLAEKIAPGTEPEKIDRDAEEGA